MSIRFGLKTGCDNNAHQNVIIITKIMVILILGTYNIHKLIQ
jgi:hypothetical protein